MLTPRRSGALFSWISSLGGDVSQVGTRDSESAGRGLVLLNTSSASRGSNIFTVPVSATISATVARQELAASGLVFSVEDDRLCGVHDQPVCLVPADRWLLIIYVTLESFDAHGKYSPYLRSLSGSTAPPSLLAAAILGDRNAVHEHSIINSEMSRSRFLFRELQKNLSNRLLSVNAAALILQSSSGGFHNNDELKRRLNWALGIVDTRSFSTSQGPALIPICDLMNHQPGAVQATRSMR